VDAGALPASLKQQVKDGTVDLDNPATTLALLKLDSVVGVTGMFDTKGSLTSMGLQCALCHSHGGRLLRAWDWEAPGRLGQP
jgi:phage baseplate assembly protein gpV